MNGVPLGDDALAPFWAAAEATGALVFIHPTTRGSSGAGFDDHYLWNLVGNPMETTVAAAHLVLSGVMERHPDLRVLLAHGGGAVLALRGRLRHGWANLAPARDAAGRAARGRRCAGSSTTRSCTTPGCCGRSSRSPAPTASCSAPTTPSTWPTRAPPTRSRAAGLDPAAERPSCGGNAARLLGLEVHR